LISSETRNKAIDTSFSDHQIVLWVVDFIFFSRNYTVVSTKRRGTKTSLDLELRINGPLYEFENRSQNLEINKSMREEIVLEPEFKTSSPIYQDIHLFSVFFMRLKEIFAEKVRALLTRERTKANDVYDLFFLMKYKNVRPKSDLISAKLKPYSIDFPSKYSKTESKV
jgi:predicted nucleotidyltransferase component of viral defense system